MVWDHKQPIPFKCTARNVSPCGVPSPLLSRIPERTHRQHQLILSNTYNAWNVNKCTYNQHCCGRVNIVEGISGSYKSQHSTQTSSITIAVYNTSKWFIDVHVTGVVYSLLIFKKKHVHGFNHPEKFWACYVLWESGSCPRSDHHNYSRCWHRQSGLLFLSGIATHDLLSFELRHSEWRWQGGCCLPCRAGCCGFLAITLDPAMAATAAARAKTMKMGVDVVVAITVEVVVGVNGIIGHLSYPGKDEGHGVLLMP